MNEQILIAVLVVILILVCYRLILELQIAFTPVPPETSVETKLKVYNANLSVNLKKYPPMNKEEFIAAMKAMISKYPPSISDKANEYINTIVETDYHLDKNEKNKLFAIIYNEELNKYNEMIIDMTTTNLLLLNEYYTKLQNSVIPNVTLPMNAETFEVEMKKLIANSKSDSYKEKLAIIMFLTLYNNFGLSSSDKTKLFAAVYDRSKLDL